MEKKQEAAKPDSGAAKNGKTTATFGSLKGSDQYHMYYSTTASSLNKRPLSQIYQENTRKGPNGEKPALQNPSTKKTFRFVTSKIDHGFKKKQASNQAAHVSDGLMAKRKDELYGRLSTHLLAKFLTQKQPQYQFIKKLKEENHVR